jgi:hypothetical protein
MKHSGYKLFKLCLHKQILCDIFMTSTFAILKVHLHGDSLMWMILITTNDFSFLVFMLKVAFNIDDQ